MTDYQKTIQVKASPDAVFDAITTAEGLSAWWTTATGSGEPGGELKFFMTFPDPLRVTVDEATRPHSVHWTVTDCSFVPDWVGTQPRFTITSVDGGSELHFQHHGLTEELDCIEECTRGWNHYMESLAIYVESGDGMPRGSSEDQARRAAGVL